MNAVTDADFSASMRPRLDCRGELDTVLRGESPLLMLQCGHGSIAVENVRSPRRERWRPRRFNAATARLPWRTRPWPRPVRCLTKLQCGHGSIAVENLAREKAGRGRPALQCGHGSIAVENASRPCPRRGRLTCFNAATARLPWRTGCSLRTTEEEGGFNAATARLPWRTNRSRAYSVAPLWLQCGHGSIAVENHELAHAMDLGSYRFNAATARLPWRTPIGTRFGNLM